MEYNSIDAFCQGTDDKAVVHLLQLGVDCTDSGTDFTSFVDYLFECGTNNTYDVVEGQYTCASAAVFSPPTQEVTPTGVAEVATDFRWGTGLFDFCYSFEPTGDTPEDTPENTTGDLTEAPTGDPCQGAGTGVGGGVGIFSELCAPTSESTPTAPTAPSEPTTTAPASPTGPTTTTPAPVSPTPPVTSTTPTPTPEAPPVTGAPGTTYSVEYVARFKRVIDDGCEGPSKDNILIFCLEGQLEILDTYDSVVCLPVQDTQDGDGQSVICETTCRDEACDDVYVDRDSFYVLQTWVLDADLYAEVRYTCSSLDVDGVDSFYLLLGSEDIGEEGRCTGEGTGDGQNLLFGELNVMCDTPEGRVAVNDDAYTECDYARSWDVNGAYTCWMGNICGDSECLVEYDRMYVFADHHHFRECIMTDNGSAVPQPQVDVGDYEAAEGQYSARFQVGSGYWYDDVNCSGRKTGIRIECIDGTINLSESGPDKSCSVVSDSTVECIETEASTVNEHVDVAVYVSFSCLYVFRGLYFQKIPIF